MPAGDLAHPVELSRLACDVAVDQRQRRVARLPAIEEPLRRRTVRAAILREDLDRQQILDLPSGRRVIAVTHQQLLTHHDSRQPRLGHLLLLAEGVVTPQLFLVGIDRGDGHLQVAAAGLQLFHKLQGRGTLLTVGLGEDLKREPPAATGNLPQCRACGRTGRWDSHCGGRWNDRAGGGGSPSETEPLGGQSRGVQQQATQASQPQSQPLAKGRGGRENHESLDRFRHEEVRGGLPGDPSPR